MEPLEPHPLPLLLVRPLQKIHQILQIPPSIRLKFLIQLQIHSYLKLIYRLIGLFPPVKAVVGMVFPFRRAAGGHCRQSLRRPVPPRAQGMLCPRA